jgi:hypothetical protein
MDVSASVAKGPKPCKEWKYIVVKYNLFELKIENSREFYFSKLVYKEAHSLKFIDNTATILMKTAYGIGKKSN